jgi:hypothetical protein
MSVSELVEYLLAGAGSSGMPGRSKPAPTGATRQIVAILLGEQPVAESPLEEATVHRPRRGSLWVASFTGPRGQVWRSTRLADRTQAQLLANHWEAEARAERAKLGRTPRKPIIRVRRSEPGTGVGPFTQSEVALLLGMSERAVRATEHRAIEKLRRHPLMRQVWQQYLTGLDEQDLSFTEDEVEALFNLSRTPEERHLTEKVLRMIQR